MQDSRSSLRLAVRAVAFTALWGVTACSSDGQASGGGADGPPVACEPGAQYACACIDGTSSFQQCNEAGTGLGACSCGTAQATGGSPGTGGAQATGGGSPGLGGATVTPVGGAGGTPPIGTGGAGVGGLPPVGAGGVPPVGAGGVPPVGAGGAPPQSGEPVIPAAISPCPAFADATMSFDVGGVPRSARVWVDLGATATLDGPVVFYWYGTGGQPSQATSGLGADGIARITQAGGIVVAPTHINAGTFPWIGGDGSDFLLMDQVIACAEQEIGIDEYHIHAAGFSAGGLFTTQLSFARSSYLASVATYSGGGGGASEDPTNLFPAMILFGGAGDQFVANFADTSRQYYDQLKAEGHFALLCDHGGGHSIPNGAQSSVVQFFFDHGFKQPTPYAAGTPVGFVNYCVQ